MKNRYHILIKTAFKDQELTPEEISAISSLYSSEGQHEIYEFAQKRKVVPFVASLLANLEKDTDIWKEVVSEYRTRNEEIINKLDEVFIRARENDVTKLFVTENFAALLAADGDKCLFASGDVDLYADISQKESIYKAFHELGYTMKERYSFKRLINTCFYNNSISIHGFYFSVAWNPLSRTKLPCLVEADSFVEWNNLWNYKRTSILLPNIDALMYICLLHISLHSFSRAPDIRLYKDIVNLSKLNVNWDKILRFAKRDNTELRILTTCYISKKLLDVKIPQIVFDLFERNEKKLNKILKLVYDHKNNDLIYEPKGIKVLKIEASVDDQGFLNGVKKILCPAREWVKGFCVGENENLFLAYLKYYRNLV